MNKVILIGRLVADPEVRYTQDNKAVARYRLAVDRQFKKDDQPTADFINCVAFGKNGEFASTYLQKGTKIAIEGKIQTGKYTKDDGTTIFTVDVVVDHHEFCEKKAESSGNYGGYSAPSTGFHEVDEDEDGELPF